VLLTMHHKLMTLLQDKLPEVVNKQKCDEFCVNFCYLNTKKSKKHLITALLKVPRTRYELIPNYARVAASLIRLYPELTAPLVSGLLKEFYMMLKMKNQHQLENKIKNIRYLGELIKFNITPPITAFHLFNRLLGDFIHHNIDLSAVLLETCGRYLYLTPYTHQQLDEVLKTLLRLRRAKNLDYRQQITIEAAYFTVKPPEQRGGGGGGGKNKLKKEYSVLEKYIQHLFFVKLNKATVEVVIKQLRKLPWQSTSPSVSAGASASVAVVVEEKKPSSADEESPATVDSSVSVPTSVSPNVEFLIIKFTLKLARMKYSNVSLVTDCLSGLSKYHPNLLVRLVDVIFEELSRGFDAPHHREQQRLISYVRLLGELFNFSALTSSAIFDLLYFILSYGYTPGTSTDSESSSSSSPLTPSLAPMTTTLISSPTRTNIFLYFQQMKKINFSLNNELDSPTDYFRIQLLCEVLDTCGVYFVKGILRTKLNNFLLYFQKYLLSKGQSGSQSGMATATGGTLTGTGVGPGAGAGPGVASLPAHVEFNVLDMFDNLESHAQEFVKKERKIGTLGTVATAVELCFPRYGHGQAEELNIAIQRLEDELNEKNLVGDGGGGDVEEEDGDDDEDGDRDPLHSSLASASLPPHSQSRNKHTELEECGGGVGIGDDEDDEQEYSRGGGGGRGEEDEEALKLMRMKVIEEDEDFEKAFRSLMLESVESAKPTSNTVGIRGGAGDRMAIPAYLPPPKNIMLSSRLGGANEDSDDDEGSSDEEGNGGGDQNKPPMKTMAFKLLGRDTKGRVETRRLLIPQDTKISVKMLQSTEHQKIEKERLKEKVLLYESMQQHQQQQAAVAAAFGGAGAGSDGQAGTVVPVEYLGNRDHFAPRGGGGGGGGGSSHQQSTIESTKWRPPNPSASSTPSTSRDHHNHQHHHQQQQQQAPPVVASYDLNLNDFLAISSAAETRKLAATAPHKANVVGSAYRQDNHNSHSRSNKRY
jgi:regulator of nonsense transcripts 2